MPTITDIREKLVLVAKELKIANGYLFDLPDEEVYASRADKKQTSKTDSVYPKCIIQLEQEDYNYQPSRRLHKTAIWNVGFVVRAAETNLEENQETVDTVVQLELIIRSFEKLVRNNINLNGTARTVFIKESWIDGGYNFPEGYVFFKVEIEYQSDQA